MQFCKNAYHSLCALALLCAVGSLKAVTSQTCDSIGTAGIPSVESNPVTASTQYGLFLNLQNPVTCTGRITEFVYTFYKSMGNNNAQFGVQLSLWRPLKDGIYNRVYNQQTTAIVDGGSPGLNDNNKNVPLSPHVYVESGDVVGMYMSDPMRMVSLVDGGSDQLCTSDTDIDTLNCSSTSALMTGQLRVQATIMPISCEVSELNITDGTVSVGDIPVTENQLLNTSVTYQCNPGYVLSGQEQRTCQLVEGSPSGEWSGFLPSCELVNIPSLTNTNLIPTGVVGSASDATASPTTDPIQPSSNTGAIVAGVVVTFVILLLVLVGIAGMIIFITHRRKVNRLDLTGDKSSNVPGLDNPSMFVPSLYEVPASDGNRYTSVKTRNKELTSETAVLFHNEKVNGVPSEVRMHYEIDELAYEEPGVTFITSTSGKEIRTPSKKEKETRSRSVNDPLPSAPDYYSSLDYSVSDQYKLLEQALVADDNPYDDDDDGISRKQTMKYMKPATEIEALYLQLNKTKVKTIQADAITLLTLLGSGQYGDVYKGLWSTNNSQDTEVAVKKLKKGASTLEQIKFLQEAAIMAQFSSKNVLSLLGVVTQEQEVMIVVELMSNGDLRDYLILMRPEKGHTIPANTNLLLLGFCRQVCLGMTYLSGKGFVHRDLAARNILVSSDRICKIGDFGMSRDLEDETYYFSVGGKIPVRWTAPEAINYRKYSSSSDVWSFGCLMYEIWSIGQKPYKDFSHEEVVDRVCSSYRLPPPPGCPKLIYELMISTWHPIPRERPEFHDIMLLLLQHDVSILEISEEAISSHPQAGELGAALEAGHNMYPDLENKYKHLFPSAD